MNAEILCFSIQQAPASHWQGGTTRELAIGPASSAYADRNFLYRMSTATVELDCSNFTHLPDYERILLTIDAPVELTHNGGAPIRLAPYQPHRFDGAWETVSRGRARDFNLMLRKGAGAGDVSVHALRAGERAALSAPANAVQLLFCTDGQAEVAVEDKTYLLTTDTCLRTSVATAELRACTDCTLIHAWAAQI